MHASPPPRGNSVSINCAHLHPKYGEKSPNEIVAEMTAEDFAGETDVNLIEYRNRRDEARRSPYPSVIVEVRATPPPRTLGTRDRRRRRRLLLPQQPRRNHDPPCRTTPIPWNRRTAPTRT